ncbi:sulfatase [Alteromonas sp. ZYF713]|nr:sulfatase [Alteromonas sp. ZYF713]
MKTLKNAVLLIIFLYAHSSVALAGSTDEVENYQQNIVMLVIDDLRPVIGAYGDEKAHTPNIDKLASNGVMFNHAYANVPVCGASRASLLTSLRPTKTRFLNFNAKAEEDVPGAKSLPQVLRESGYYTMAIGKIFHHSSDLADESWSERPVSGGLPHATTLNPESEKYKKPNEKRPNNARGPWYESANVADEDYGDGKAKVKALAALDKLAKQEQPFFLSVGFIRPHLPFNAPKQYYDLHPKNKFEPFFHRERPRFSPSGLKGSGEIQTYHFKDYDYNSDEFHVASQRGYYASVSYVDALIGDIMQRISALGLEKNTTVILLSDHGFNLGEHNFWGKHNMLNTALRVPLIVAGPSIVKNEETDALVELIDIFPTITDIANVSDAKDIAGESFIHVLKNPELEHKKQIYSRFKAGDSVVSKDHIYTLYTTENQTIEEMLFDLNEDPYETQNTASHPKYSDVKSKLHQLLLTCMEQLECDTH